MNTNTPVESLYKLCQRWAEEARGNKQGPNIYFSILNRIDRYSSLRYQDYEPSEYEVDSFLLRLARWVLQTEDNEQRKTLLRFVDWIMYIDEREMQSLYRDLYRQVIVPWTTPPEHSFSYEFDDKYEINTRKRLKSYHFYSITDSFQFNKFNSANALFGLPKPITLGEQLAAIPTLIKKSINSTNDIIVLEDMVGTGNQSARVLEAVVQNIGENRRVLFAPLIALEGAVRPDSQLTIMSGVDVRPVLIVPSSHCLTKTPRPNDTEPEIFKEMRSIIYDTSIRVLKPMPDMDDQPEDAFGYGGSGALVVTHHNTPNNTLPLIHHKAPEWEPLFRRIHHSYGGKK